MKTRYFIENTSIDYYGIRRRNVIIFSIVSGTFDSQIFIKYIAFIFTYASQFYPEYFSSAVLPLVSFGCPCEGGKICLLNFILLNKNELSYATYTVQKAVKLDVFLCYIKSTCFAKMH